MKKAQSISINTIIVAAIGLAVLVILFAIFTGRLGKFSMGVEKTDTCQQKCSALSMDKGPDVVVDNACSGTVIAGKYSDVAADAKCCCI